LEHEVAAVLNDYNNSLEDKVESSGTVQKPEKLGKGANL
jgi:hypothetical protein